MNVDRLDSMELTSKPVERFYRTILARHSGGMKLLDQHEAACQVRLTCPAHDSDLPPVGRGIPTAPPRTLVLARKNPQVCETRG